jgi:purine-binding chemotaxis protein CheW
MTPLPLTPHFVLGVMNLRGIVVPVIDLGARLGLPAATLGRRSCVVLVDAPPGEDGKPMVMGVLVDAVHEVFSARDEDAEAPPRLGMRVPADLVRSILRVRGRATTELDLGAVLEPQALGNLIHGHGQLH